MTTTKTVKVNGIDIRFSDEGPNNAPVVMMSHSLSAELGMWDPQIDALKDDYRIIRFDTRGHGGSSAPVGPYTLEMLADDAIGLMDALELMSVHWVGLSMGGMIGQTVALKAPERLKSLTLADTSSGYPAEAVAGWEERISAARKNGMSAGLSGTIERWFSPGFVKAKPEIIDRISQMIVSTPVEGYCGCGSAISRLNITPQLGEISAPTLVIVGEDDPGTPVEMSEIMAKGIPGAKLVILPIARHLSNIEDPAGFNQALKDFLDSVSSS